MLRSVHALLLLSLLIGASPVLASPMAAFGAFDRGNAWEAASDGDHAPSGTPLAEAESEEEERDGEGALVQFQPGGICLALPAASSRATIDRRRAPHHEPSFRVSPSRGPPTRR